MGMLDQFPEQPADPWQDLSLAEQAAAFEPPVWQPAHVEPEGVTPLPEDFPVLDPCARRPETQRIMAVFAEKAKCKTKECGLDDREVLAEQAAELYVEGIESIQAVAIALYAHGETMLAEAIVDNLVCMSADLIKPFLDSAGIDSEIGD